MTTIIILSCNKDDDNVITLTFPDFVTKKFSMVISGDILGSVRASTSNNANINYAIISQQPSGAVRINPNNGDLIVEDFTLLNSNTDTSVVLEVRASANGLVETATITIQVEGVEDIDGDGVLDTIDSDIYNPCSPDQNQDFTDYNPNNRIWKISDCDADQISNGDEISEGTNPYNADSDGDGINDNIDPERLNPCFPEQFPGYANYDPINPLWLDADCDQDGVINSTELMDGTDPYTNSDCPLYYINTSIWEGSLKVQTLIGNELFDVLGPITGNAECGELVLIGDILSFGDCENPPTTTIKLEQFVPNVKEGRVIVESQNYDCTTPPDIINSLVDGTYTEESKTIRVKLQIMSSGFTFTSEILITPLN
ncbi:cadherin repeat domain-containing protein [Flavivirga rizhaonensis]|uniref:Cadherin repeat domain-containing protein n=2 Tax=Flavivirga rizhaonensis TaxID=2559571 RepID=A0A4S1DVF2_9FLAO|nr:cadherin repeat domain-containing protein [Flavivirga rizhaonensis]